MLEDWERHRCGVHGAGEDQTASLAGPLATRRNVRFPTYFGLSSLGRTRSTPDWNRPRSPSIASGGRLAKAPSCAPPAKPRR